MDFLHRIALYGSPEKFGKDPFSEALRNVSDPSRWKTTQTRTGTGTGTGTGEADPLAKAKLAAKKFVMIAGQTGTVRTVPAYDDPDEPAVGVTVYHTVTAPEYFEAPTRAIAEKIAKTYEVDLSFQSDGITTTAEFSV